MGFTNPFVEFLLNSWTLSNKLPHRNPNLIYNNEMELLYINKTTAVPSIWNDATTSKRKQRY